jgi:hypothetical protein
MQSGDSVGNEEQESLSRRALLARVAAALSLSPLALGAQRVAQAADPLLSEQDSAAKAVHYVTDAKRAQGASPGADCSNCSIFSGKPDATTGACALFPHKLVAAAGWCSSWSGL